MRLLNGWILARPTARIEQKTEAGIHLAEGPAGLQGARVAAVSEPWTQDGAACESRLLPGETIWYDGRNVAGVFVHEGRPHLLVHEQVVRLVTIETPESRIIVAGAGLPS